METTTTAKENQIAYLFNLVNSWLQSDQPPFGDEKFQQLIKCIQFALKVGCVKTEVNSEACLFPAFVYADRYIQMHGKIRGDQVLDLLIITALISLKMYNDNGADVDGISFIAGIPKKELSVMERNFLVAVHYNLFINASIISIFL